MSNKFLCIFASTAVLLSALIIGCGGSSSVAPGNARTTPPSALAMQGGSALDGSVNVINADIAVKGPTIVVGSDANDLNAVWVGSQKILFYSDLVDAGLITANYDYAVGSYAGGSFVWQYKTPNPVTTIPADSITNVAKNADVFLDLGLASDQITPTANMLTVHGQKLVRVPYAIPALDYTTYTLGGVAINSSGLALVDVFTQTSFGVKVPATAAARQALIRKLCPPILGNAAQRFARLKTRLKPTTASPTPSGYYLLSTTQAPLPLSLPTGASSVVVLAVNDQGISVGAAYTGDPNNPTILPYYWDAQGNAYPMQLTTDLNYGYASDINSEGTVVGQVGNDITTYGSMWNTAGGTPTNLNTLVPSTFQYNIQYINSVGNDFTMAAIGNPTADTTTTIYFGLQPQ